MVNAASSTASHAYRQTLGDPKVFRLLQLLPFFLKSFHKTVVKVGVVVVVIRASGDPTLTKTTTTTPTLMTTTTTPTLTKTTTTTPTLMTTTTTGGGFR